MVDPDALQSTLLSDQFSVCPYGGNPVVDRHVYVGCGFCNLSTPQLNPIVEGKVPPSTLQITPDIKIDTNHFHESNTCWERPSGESSLKN